MKIYIYKITNKINGKIYIGKHIDKSKNGIDDYMGSGIIIKNAQKKYGIENFTKDILEECTKEDVDQKEIFWIEKLQSTNYKIGYNVTKGGDGGDTFTNNPKAESLRKQFSEQIKGNKNPNFGKHHSEKRKQQIRDANIGLIYWNNGKENKRSKTCPGNGWIEGIIVTKESFEKRSKSHIGKISSFKGKHHSEEARKKLSISHKGILIGENNPSAKVVEAISPTGEKYIVKGTIKNFCKEHNISYSMYRRYRDKGPCPDSKFSNSYISKNTVGWIFNLINKE